MEFFQTLPDWVKILLPQTLIKVLQNDIHEPITSGRKQALENDNINDFVYYARKKSFFSDENNFLSNFLFSKTDPFHYTLENKKFKCHIFLAIYHRSFRLHLYNPFIKNDAPDWYNYSYIYLNPVHMKNMFTDTLYTLFITNPRPIECLEFILKKLKEYKSPDKLLQRKKVNKDIDYAFYCSLSKEEDRIKILTLIRKKQIFLDIHQHIFDLGNYDHIFALSGPVKLFEYSINYVEQSKLKKFIDAHQDLFANLRNCSVIRSKFKSLYEYAFSKTVYNDVNEEHKKFVENHVCFLAENRQFDEIAFIMSKGWKWTPKSAWNAFGVAPDCVELILLMDHKIQLKLADHALNNNFDLRFKSLINMGFRPSVFGIRNEFSRKKLKPNVENFEILNLIPESIYLDEIKGALARFHPELIPEFISKFSSRFKYDDLDCWKLEESYFVDCYVKACKVLNVNKKSYIKQIFKNCFEVSCCDRKAYCIRRNMMMYCLDNFSVVKAKPKHLEMAMDFNDVEMAKLMIQNGAHPFGVPDWQKHCSSDMYIAIKAIID